MLLKHITENEKIAPKLLASSEDLEALAKDDNADIKLLKGWRRELFGNTALKLKSGEIALTIKNNKIYLISNNYT